MTPSTVLGGRRLRGTTLAIAAMLGALLVSVTGAEALTTVGGHEIEADLESNTEPSGNVDWVPNDGQAPGGAAGETGIFDTPSEACPPTNAASGGLAARPNAVVDAAFQATLICDSVSFPGNPDANIFVGGAKEDDPDSQTIKSSPVTPKTDLTHAYARGVIAPDSGNTPVNTGNSATWGDANNDPDAWVIAAYEVIPKQGSYHTNVEFNQKVKCVTGSSAGQIVDSVTGCGAGAQVVPFRTAGDVLLAVDIGGSNDPAKKIRLLGFIATGGTATTNATYNFGNNETQNIANANFSAFGGSAGIDNGVARAAINADVIDCAAWGCFDEGYNLAGTMPAEAFVEVAVNLSAFTPNVCLNNVAFKSRASGQSVTSQLKDTTNPQPFPFCGGLAVRKYIDPAENGGNGAGTDDLTSQTAITAALSGVTSPFGTVNDLQGWSINVYRDDGATPDELDATDTLVCTGTTNVNGLVSCSQGANALTQLTPGKYHIRELTPLKSGFQNTDPGGTAPFVETVTVGLGSSTTAWIGNTCLMTAAFSITGVPADTPSTLVAWYDTGADADVAGKSANATEVALTGTTTRTGTSARVFKINDKIEVGYSIGSDVKVVTTHTFGVADAYPKCRRDVPLSFDAATIVMEKYKDITNNGKSADDTLLGGWQFNLYRDNGDGNFDAATDTLVSGSPFTGATSGADLGRATKTGLAPGVYHVTEVEQTNWLRTTPSTSNLVTLTVGIGGSQTAVFANTPLSRVKVEFQDLTGYTDGTITCPTAIGSAGSSTGETNETESVESSTLPVGTYQCTVVIVDP